MNCQNVAVISIILVGLLSGGALAQEQKMSRVVEGLKVEGVTACSKELDGVVKYVHKDDGRYGFAYMWSKENTNKRSAVVVTSERLSGGSMISTFVSTPDASGHCSVVVTQNFLLKQSCTGIREETFKGWKFYGEISATTAYDSPDSEALTAFLTATEDGGCHILRRLVYYY